MARFADHFARVPGCRVPRGAAPWGGVVVARDDAVGDYDVFLLLDFDETHGCGLSVAGERLLAGMRSRCDSWGDQCGVQSRLNRGEREMCVVCEYAS